MTLSDLQDFIYWKLTVSHATALQQVKIFQLTCQTDCVSVFKCCTVVQLCNTDAQSVCNIAKFLVFVKDSQKNVWLDFRQNWEYVTESKPGVFITLFNWVWPSTMRSYDTC